jgi:nucleoside phosphorylase
MEPKRSGVDILIVTALAEEQRALQQFFVTDEEHHSTYAPLTYHKGSTKSTSDGISYSIAITCLFGMGNPEAGILAANAIRELNPTYIIMFGIAGGIKERIGLGDVIISTQIFYYEQAKLLSDKIEIRPISFHVDAILKNRLASFAEQSQKNYSVKFGPFAVGEKIIANATTVEALKDYEPKLLGIEMESFGVAAAASYALQRPRFIAIRGISDHADELKNDDSRHTALTNAADFLFSFLQSGILITDRTNSLEKTDSLIAIHHLSLDRRTAIQSSIKTSLPQFRHYSIQEIVIDQSSFYKDGSLKEPGLALELQRDFSGELNSHLQNFPDAKIGYFSLAHIPLMFHMGYETNRREVQVFATNRRSGQWIKLSDKATKYPKIFIKNLPAGIQTDITEIVIKMSVSYPVFNTQVEPVIDLSLIPVLDLGLLEPELDIIKSEEQLDSYALAFQQTLADIHNSFPNIKKIHLFFAGPPTLAFRCGQQISKTVDPDIIVYNFSIKDTPNYGWGLNIQREEVIDLRKES